MLKCYGFMYLVMLWKDGFIGKVLIFVEGEVWD